MKGKIKFFQKCVAFRPSVLGMRTRSSEGVLSASSKKIIRFVCFISEMWGT